MMTMGAILLKNILLDGQPSDIYVDNGLVCNVVSAGATLSAEMPAGTLIMDCTGKASTQRRTACCNKPPGEVTTL